jgi:hypothetical protein
MDANPQPLILALAEAISVWFPDLGGRSVAVSEVEAFGDKTNVPTLPLAFTALIRETSDQGAKGGTNITITQDLLVQFIYEPVKYNRQDGTQTPFFAFYDYEKLRDRLLTFLSQWRTPRNGNVAYKSLDVSSEPFGVFITFNLQATERWCPDDKLLEQPFNISIVARLLQPKSTKPCCEDNCPPKPDPCDFAR